MINKVTEELEVEVPDELPPETKDINHLRDYSEKMEKVIEKQMQLMEHKNLYYAAQDIESKQLDDERDFFYFKLKSFNLKILPVVNFFKIKHFINFVFPLLAFIISIAALVFYIIRHR